MVFSIPRLTVEGGTLTGAELARLADPKDKTPLDERLARVTAKRIVVPEIRGESKAGGRVTRLVYKDVVLEDIANGRIGALRAASLEQSAKGAGGAVEARYAKSFGQGRRSAPTGACPGLRERERQGGGQDHRGGGRDRGRLFHLPDPKGRGLKSTPGLSRRWGCARARSPTRRSRGAGRRRDAGPRRRAGADGPRRDGFRRLWRARCRRDRTWRAGRKSPIR